jgi:beta-lactam-binding protein with PASTA domain
MRKWIAGMVVVTLLMGGLVVAWAQDDEKGAVKSLRSVQIAVPNVIGKSLSESINILNAAGLKPQTQPSDRDGALRIVVRQDPAAGARVPRGTLVNIFGQLASDVKGRVNLPR